MENNHLSILLKALEIEPNLIEARLLLGELYFNISEYNNALIHYNKALESSQNLNDSRYVREVLRNINFVYDNISAENKIKLFVNNAHHNMFDENPDQKLIFNKILKFLNSN